MQNNAVTNIVTVPQGPHYQQVWAGVSGKLGWSQHHTIRQLTDRKTQSNKHGLGITAGYYSVIARVTPFPGCSDMAPRDIKIP